MQKYLPAAIVGLAGVFLIAAMIFAVALAAAFTLVGGGGGSGGQTAGGGTTGNGIVSCTGQALGGKVYKGGDFKEFVPIYQAAAKKYNLGPDGPSILASIHEVESGFRGSAHGASSSVGAQGPMQFMPPTWASYGVDANGDGKKNIDDPEDAIFGAANYLKASGAPNWQHAIMAYNHAQWYVDKVLAGSKKFKIPACA